MLPEQSLGNHRETQKERVGVIFISHNLNDIFQVSDRILVLRRGEKVGERLVSQANDEEVVRLMAAGWGKCGAPNRIEAARRRVFIWTFDGDRQKHWNSARQH